MTTNGDVGECPDWYVVVTAARYLKVPPWELAERSMFWLEIAHASMTAEGNAQRHAERQAAKRG